MILKNKDKIMDFEQFQLAEILKTASLVTDKTSPYPSFSNITFTSDGICAMNMSCFLFAKMDLEIDKSFGVAPELFSMIDSVKSDDIEINLKEGFLTIESADMRGKLSYTEEINENLMIGIPDVKEFKDLPLNFVDSLKKIYKVSSKNEFEAETYCFLCDGKYVYTTNSALVGRVELEMPIEKISNSEETSVLFPVDALKVLNEAQPLKYCADSSWIFFESEFFALGFRQVEPGPKKPQIINLFGSENKWDYSPLPEDFKTIIDEASLFSDMETGIETMRFEFKEDKLLISSNNAKGQIHKFIDFQNKHNVNNFLINTKFVKMIAPFVDDFASTNTFKIFKGEDVLFAVANMTDI